MEIKTNVRSLPKTWDFTPSPNYVSPNDPKNDPALYPCPSLRTRRALPTPPSRLNLGDLEAQQEYLDKKIASVRALQRAAIEQRDEEMMKIEAAIAEMKAYEEWAEVEIEKARQEREMASRVGRMTEVVYEPYKGGRSREVSRASTVKYAGEDGEKAKPIAAYRELSGAYEGRGYDAHPAHAGGVDTRYVGHTGHNHAAQTAGGHETHNTQTTGTATGGNGLLSKYIDEPPKTIIGRKPLSNSFRSGPAPGGPRAPNTHNQNHTRNNAESESQSHHAQHHAQMQAQGHSQAQTQYQPQGQAQGRGRGNRVSDGSERTVVVDANAIGNTSSWATIF